MANNNVTAGSVTTPTLSANQIMIGEETLSAYIAKMSTGSTVTPELSAGIKIATISGSGENKELFAPKQETEYTAIEVHPTDVEIPAGTIDEVTGLEYKVAVPAQMTCKLTVRSDGPDAYTGFKINWGDGTIEGLPAGADTSKNKLTVEHTYSEPGRYIVKIYGRIFGFINEKISEYNLISRIWDADLPMASTCHSWKQICDGNLRLQKVDIPYTYCWSRANLGLYRAFKNAKNLISFTSHAPTPFCHSMQEMFMGCNNMITCDMEYEGYGIWKSVDGRYSTMFADCTSLTTKVNRIIPIRGWCTTRLHVEDFFRNCTSLPADVGSENIGNDIGAVLWKVDGTPYEFWDKGDMFKTCSDALRALIPVSFGGTKA